MLTDRKVRNAKRPKPYKLADANRLFLLAAPGGGKLWRWNYDYDGRSKTMALAAYPLVTLADARAKRDEAYTILCEGHDPAVEKKRKKEAVIEAGRQTFERVAREWHGNTKQQWAKMHAADVLRSLEQDVFPAICSLPIAQLTPPIVLCVLSEIEARGAIETAKRVRRRISAAFTYAIAQGITKDDPAEKLGAVLKPLRKGRQPAITDLASLRRMIEDDHCGGGGLCAAYHTFGLALFGSHRRQTQRAARRPVDEFEDLNGSEPLWRIPPRE